MIKDKTLAENFLRRDGRLNRWRYFKRNLVIAIIMSVLMFVVTLIFFDIAKNNVSTAGKIMLMIVTLIMFIPNYCLVVRRLHDMDRDELLAKVYIAGGVTSCFLNFILNYQFMPLDVIMVIVSLYILFVPGTYGANRYGPDPLR